MRAVDPVRDGPCIDVANRIKELYKANKATSPFLRKLLSRLAQLVGGQLSREFRKGSKGHPPPHALTDKTNGGGTHFKNKYGDNWLARLDELIKIGAKKLYLHYEAKYAAQQERARQTKLGLIDAPIITTDDFDDLKFG
jgi:hypothetical protein